MKTVQVQIIDHQIKVLQNRSQGSPDYAQIKVGGKVLHTGQPAYIRRVAREKYSYKASL